MRKFAGLALGFAALAAPTSAHAVDPTKTIGWCSSVANVCATAKFTLTGGNNLEMLVYNGWAGTTYTGGTASYINDIVIYGLPFAGVYTEGSAQFFDFNSGTNTQTVTSEGAGAWGSWTWSGTGGFSPNPGGNPFGIGGDHGYVGIATCAGPVDAAKKTQTCNPSGTGPQFDANEDYARFLFTFASPITAPQFAGLQWGAHVQAIGGTGQSIKCYSGANMNSAEQNCPGIVTENPPGGGTGEDDVVPEPATMTLMAVGLAGMAVANRKRRKQR